MSTISRTNDNAVISTIERAFQNRPMPDPLYAEGELGFWEAAAIDSVKSSLLEGDLCGDVLEENSEFIFHVTPLGFCFFIPKIMILSIREKEPGLLVCHSIVMTLSRSPEIDWWDDFFLSRFLLLSIEECDAVSSWMMWLVDNNNFCFTDDQLIRSLETLDLVRKRIKINAV